MNLGMEMKAMISKLEMTSEINLGPRQGSATSRPSRVCLPASCTTGSLSPRRLVPARDDPAVVGVEEGVVPDQAAEADHPQGLHAEDHRHQEPQLVRLLHLQRARRQERGDG